MLPDPGQGVGACRQARARDGRSPSRPVGPRRGRRASRTSTADRARTAACRSCAATPVQGGRSRAATRRRLRMAPLCRTSVPRSPTVPRALGPPAGLVGPRSGSPPRQKASDSPASTASCVVVRSTRGSWASSTMASTETGRSTSRGSPVIGVEAWWTVTVASPSVGEEVDHAGVLLGLLLLPRQRHPVGDLLAVVEEVGVGGAVEVAWSVASGLTPRTSRSARCAGPPEAEQRWRPYPVPSVLQARCRLGEVGRAQALGGQPGQGPRRGRDVPARRRAGPGVPVAAPGQGGHEQGGEDETAGTAGTDGHSCTVPDKAPVTPQRP